MSVFSDDSVEIQHMGAEERNGPEDWLAGGMHPDFEPPTVEESKSPIQVDGGPPAPGTSHVSEGMTYLDPSLATEFTGIDSKDIAGLITSF